MTPNQAIRAGGLAMNRRDLRKIAHIPGAGKLTVRTPQGDVSVYLDGQSYKAAVEAVDLDLSDRLLKLGVSELDEPLSLPAPAQPGPSGVPSRPSGRRGPRPDGVQRPPEDA